MMSIPRPNARSKMAFHLPAALLLFAAPITSAAAASDSGQLPTVNAPAGQVRGQMEDDIEVFKGIPYALPPVGGRRWTPPARMPRWSGVKEAREFGPACPQPESQLSSIYAGDPMPMDEDCLTLNIWLPKGAHKAPVFFWIHGGALVTGSSREPVYNGTPLASRGVIVVSINYRLGVLGWLAHPELSKESPLGISGNYGLLDQLEALRWVQRNIGSFGGDPANVTIAGESAGALSVMYVLSSPDARSLFSKAILESAYMISTPELKQRSFGTDSAEASGVKLAMALNAPDIAALRAMDALTLSTAAPTTGYAPWGTVDGYVLPRQLVDVFDRRKEAAVPLLAGFNSGEIRSLRMLAPAPPASAVEYEQIIRERYGDLADDFLRRYPSSNMQESILAATRDALYGWTAERLVRKQTALGQPSFLYFFDHGYPAEDNARLHAFHASELPFVFGTRNATPPLWPKIPVTSQETKVSEAMLDYWSSFARTGHPQANGEPDWPVFGSKGSFMNFTDAPHPSAGLLPGMYELNETVVCRDRVKGDIAWNRTVGIASPVLPGPAAQCHF